MIWLIAAITVWGIVHSWLASLGAKDAFRRMFGEGARVYRLAYNIFSVISFVPILLLVRALPDRLLYAVQAPWLYLMLAGQGVAVVFLLVGVLQTGALSFIGLRQLVGEQIPAQLATGGLYAWMRHPLYFFGLVVLWLTPRMTANMLAAYVALTAYLFVGAYFEERKLLREFGEVYARYRATTPMILPVRIPMQERVHPGSDSGSASPT
jgi:methanethiol S-methyltransferase